MAQMERLKEETRSKQGKGSKGGKTPRKGSWLSFNPTPEEKKTISGDDRPLEEVMLSIESVLQDGHRVTLQYNSDYDCYSAIVREGGVPWESAVAMSCWHNEISKCLRMLDYALRIKYPDFPAGAYQRSFIDVEW
jgi:hypothetical protein